MKWYASYSLFVRLFAYLSCVACSCSVAVESEVLAPDTQLNVSQRLKSTRTVHSDKWFIDESQLNEDGRVIEQLISFTLMCWNSSSSSCRTSSCFNTDSCWNSPRSICRTERERERWGEGEGEKRGGVGEYQQTDR